jgi:hypothetical protein
LDPGGGIGRSWPVGVPGGVGNPVTAIVGTEAGSFAAIPKSVNFQVFVLDEYRTHVSDISKWDVTILRLQVAVGEVEIVAFLNAFHDVANDGPYFCLVQVRFLLNISLVDIAGQICFAQFHEDAVFVEFWIDLIPPVVNSHNIFRVVHTTGGDDIEFSAVERSLEETDQLQCIYLNMSEFSYAPYRFVLKLRFVFYLLLAGAKCWGNFIDDTKSSSSKFAEKVEFVQMAHRHRIPDKLNNPRPRTSGRAAENFPLVFIPELKKAREATQNRVV